MRDRQIIEKFSAQLCFALLISAAVLCPATAQAQSARHGQTAHPTTNTANNSNVIAARASFEQGVQLLQDSQFAQAAAAFESSYQNNPVPVVLFNLAFAYRGLGRTRDALHALERFLESPGNTPADRITAAREEQTRLTAMIAHLSITAVPSTAQLTMDAHPIEGSLTDVLLDPGAHVIEARQDGFRPFRQEFNLAPGARETITARLAEIDDQGRLHVEPSVPNARVSVDGTVIGIGSIDISAHAGMHRVDIVAEGYLPLRRDVRVPGVGMVRVDALLQRPRSNPWVWLGPVIAGAALVVGGSIWGIAEATRGEVGPTVNNCWNCVTGR